MVGTFTKSELKRQRDDEHRQHLQADEAKHRRLEEEERLEIQRNQELQARSRQLQGNILQMDLDGQNVFTTPQQNLLAARALMDSIVPMLGEDNAATPIATRVKAMITTAAIQ